MSESKANINKNRKDVSFLYVDAIDEKSDKLSHQQFFNLIMPNYENIYKTLQSRNDNKERTLKAENFFAKILGKDYSGKLIRNRLEGKVSNEVILSYHCDRKTICDWFTKEKDGRFIFTPQILASFLGHILACIHDVSFLHFLKTELFIDDDLIPIQEDVKPIFENILNHVQVDSEKLKKNSASAENERKSFNEYIRNLCDGFGARVGIKTALQVNDQWMFFQKEISESDKSIVNGVNVISENVVTLQVESENNGLLDTFYSRLQRNFSTIDLALPDLSYSIPVDQMIDFSLSEENVLKRKQLEALRDEFIKSRSEEERSKLERAIKSVEKELARKYEIVPLLENGENIFILAPAGTGKSTLLRWIVYTCSQSLINSSKLLIPIFIDLKYIRRDNEFILSIEEYLNNYSAPLDQHELYRYVLLIDGYDEFTGDEVQLFKEIVSWKSGKEVQIVFSGRDKPDLADNNIRYIVFNLNPIGMNAMRSFFIHRLGEETGSYWIEIVESRGVEQHLSNPLFLTFLLILIEEKKGGKLSADDIEKYIVNEGLLLKELVVDQFLYYEKHKEVHSQVEWIEERTLMIKTLKALAFYMTFELNNKDVIHRSVAMLVIKQNADKNKQVDSSQLLSTLCEHSFLHKRLSLDKNEILYSFQKKELRAFFSSLQLIEKVDTRRSYNGYIRKLRGKSRSETIISSINSYSYGLADSSMVLRKNRFLNRNDHFLISTNGINDLQFVYEFLSKGNRLPDYFPQEPTFYIDFIEDWLFSKFIFSTDKRAEKYEKTSIFIGFFEGILIQYFIPVKWIKSKRIEYQNGFRILNYGFWKYIIDAYIKFTRRFDIERYYSVFEKLEKLHELGSSKLEGEKSEWLNDYNYKFEYANQLLITGLLSEEEIDELSIVDKVKLCFSVLMQKNRFSLIYIKSMLCRVETSEFLETHSERFLRYFLEHINTSSYIPYFRLFLFIKNRGTRIFRIDSTKFTSDEVEEITKMLVQACVCLFQEDLNKFSYTKACLVGKLDQTMKINVKAGLIDLVEVSENPKEQILAVKSLLVLGEKKYLSQITNYIDLEEEKGLVLFACKNLIQLRHPVFQETFFDFHEIVDSMLPVIEDDRFSIEIKNEVIIFFAQYRTVCTPKFESAVINYWESKKHLSSSINHSFVLFLKHSNNLMESVSFLEELLSISDSYYLAYEALIYKNNFNIANGREEFDVKGYRMKIELDYNICLDFIGGLISQNLNKEKTTELSDFVIMEMLYIAGYVGGDDMLSSLRSVDRSELSSRNKKFLDGSILMIEERFESINQAYKTSKL